MFFSRIYKLRMHLIKPKNIVDATNMTEKQLIDACKKKESFAQRQLYNCHVGSMFVLCMRYLDDAKDAEEVLSDAFLNCFQKINQFTYRGPGSLRAWLSKIVVNQCLMFLRKHKQLIVPIETERSQQIAIDNDVIENLTAKDILMHVRSLPIGYRTVLNLYAFEGKSHKEIASLLQISENTSKSQLFKARAMLREKLHQL